MPQAKWGSVALGLTPKQLRALRWQCNVATGRPVTGRCAYTQVQLEYGADKDPVYTVVSENLREWLSLCLNNQKRYPQLFADTQAQWTQWHLKLKPEHTRWKRTKGPPAAALSTVLDLGWVPIGPMRWITDEGSVVDAQAPSFDSSEVDRAVATTVAKQAWQITSRMPRSVTSA